MRWHPRWDIKLASPIPAFSFNTGIPKYVVSSDENKKENIDSAAMIGFGGFLKRQRYMRLPWPGGTQGGSPGFRTMALEF